MDDVWGNAWGDTAPSTADPASDTPWSSPPIAPPEEEADLAVPSWSTASALRWVDPPDTQGSIWSQPSSSAVPWAATSPYSDIPLGRSHSPHPANHPESSGHGRTLSPSSEPESPEDGTAGDPAVPSSERDSPVPSSSTSRPASPDAFGTFTGASETPMDAPWTDSSPNFSGDTADDWGSAWAAPKGDTSSPVEGETLDEWEAARRQKEVMDRMVPPELLSSILRQVEELSELAWPDPPPTNGVPDWQTKWRTGMDGVDGLDALLVRYVPAMELPQLTPFARSFTVKAMSNAIKLSRNAALARSSPMATLLAAKGSTAWETSVKSRIDVVKDEVPVGWRIVEKEENERADDEKAKKSGGGLLASLWNRRTSSVPKEYPKLSSPVQANTDDVAARARSSTDSVKSTSSGLTRITSAPSPSSASVGPIPSASRNTSTNYSEGGITFFEPIMKDVPPPTQAPSAVSRFFNRFSRSSSASSSKRNSLALSTNDLEFLSDLVPSAADGDEDMPSDPQIRGLENMIASKPFTGKLPPLLPPPPALPTPLPSQNTKSPTQSGSLSTSFDILEQGRSENSSPSPSVLALQVPSSRPLSPASPPPSQANGQTPAHQPTTSIFSQLGSFNFPPPPSSLSGSPWVLTSATPTKSVSQQSTLPSTTPLPAPLPPPTIPLSSSFATPQPGLSQPLTTAFDDDDFSDFLSSGAPSSKESSAKGGQPLFDPILSTHPPSHQEPSSSSFGDFDNFVSFPALRAPSRSTTLPPVTPANPASTPQPAPAISLVERRRGSRASDHQNTLNLVVNAAARPGRWPAPASPLPEALPPPPAVPSNHTGLGTLLEDPAPVLASTLSASTSHDKTVNLLEKAAARPGRWPAPLSPTPPMLSPPPPPPPPVGALLNGDIFGGIPPSEVPFTFPPPPYTSSVLAAPAPRPAGVTSSQPLLPPPPGVSPLLSTPPKSYTPDSMPLTMISGGGLSTSTVNSSSGPMAQPPPLTSTRSKDAGGLSAQDLSFFEGL